MKTVSVRDLQRKIRECVQTAQKERVVITRRGQPAVLMIGVEGSDWEDLVYRTSPAFWKMIERRRKEAPISMDEARKRLHLPRKAGRKSSR